MTTKLILASRSPRRKQILKDLGVRFTVVPADIDEHHGGLKKPHAIAQSIAFRKALKVAQLHPNQWVLGCDTFVVHANGRIALKPGNREEARRTLKRYRDSYCDVYSGLAMVLFGHETGMLSQKGKQKANFLMNNKLSQNSLKSKNIMSNKSDKNLYKKFVHFEKTRLKFGHFSDESIEQYLGSDEWRDSSGSMTIEGDAGKWITKMEGDYWNVVGLPTQLLKKFLKEIATLN